MTDEAGSDLVSRRCVPCEGGTAPLQSEVISSYLVTLPEWELIDGRISRRFGFKNFYQTMAFVNAVAWIAHTENHHPEMEVSYKSCVVSFRTEAISGLSINDFISAAKVQSLIQAQ